MNNPYAIGVDLGGTGVKAVGLAPDGNLLCEMTRPFNAAQPMHFADTVRALVQELIDQQGREPMALGLCAPGLAAADQRSISVWVHSLSSRPCPWRSVRKSLA